MTIEELKEARKDFEEWAAEAHSMNIDRDHDGDYVDDATSDAWFIWEQAVQCVAVKQTEGRWAMRERKFPIQRSYERGVKPHPMEIPWSVAELAYSQYAARYGASQSLQRLSERGGFGPQEMDLFLPDWRERCDELVSLRAEVEELKRDKERLDWLDSENVQLERMWNLELGKPGNFRLDTTSVEDNYFIAPTARQAIDAAISSTEQATGGVETHN